MFIAVYIAWRESEGELAVYFMGFFGNRETMPSNKNIKEQN